MPRRSSSTAGSAFDQLQQQARALIGTLRKEIRTKEAELQRLKEDESRLGMLTGKDSAPARTGARSSRRAAGGGGGGGGRIDWRAVLEQLPKQFKASDVRGIRGLKEKRPSEIFAAVTRWINAGIVKRKSRGMYERAS
jgi:hypothetical protein